MELEQKVMLSGFNWPETRHMMGYFECGNTRQHNCELIKKRPFEFLQGGGGVGGGGTVLDQKKKISF
jgi:hypothetical protein